MKKRQSRGIEVDWGDGTGWNERRPSNAGAIALTPEALQQIQQQQHHTNSVNVRDSEIPLVTEFPVDSQEPSTATKPTSSPKTLSRSESAPDPTLATGPTEGIKKKRATSFIPRLPGLPPFHHHAAPAPVPVPATTEPIVTPAPSQSHPPIILEEEKSESTESNQTPQDRDMKNELNSLPTSSSSPHPPSTPAAATPAIQVPHEKKKERTSIFGKLGLKKSPPSNPQPEEPVTNTRHSDEKIEDLPLRSRSSTDEDGRKKHSLLDRLGLHHHTPTEAPIQPLPPPVPSNLPPRFYMSLQVILPHGVNIYATPNSDSRLLLKLRKLNCGDIISVHTLRILDNKHWYESDNGWVEGTHHEKKDKIIRSRGLMFCSNGIPTKSKVLKLHFNEVLKKGWFRNTTTYETEFILEIYFMSPETGIENNILRLKRSFRSLEQLQGQLSLKYSDLAWKLFEMTVHGFPVLTDGAIGIIEDPDRALQLMDAMGNWISIVLSKIDVQSCTELSHFLRPNEVDCAMMDIDLSPTGGLNGAW